MENNTDKCGLYPASITNDYYVQHVTEEYRKQLEKLDEEEYLCCTYPLDYPKKAVGYILFERSKNPSIPDEFSGYCILDKEEYRDKEDCIDIHKEENIENIKRQFPTYDFSNAVDIDIDPYPTDKNLEIFFIEQVIHQYNQVIFFKYPLGINEQTLKDLGFQRIENEWIYLPEEAMKHRVYFTCQFLSERSYLLCTIQMIIQQSK